MSVASSQLGTNSAVLVTDAPEQHAEGEWATARDYRMRVDHVTVCKPELPLRPTPQKVLLGVRVQLSATSTRGVPANAFYATLRDASGDEYPSTLAGCEPFLRAQLLAEGASAEGYISFEVPQKHHRFELRYAPQVIGPGLEELRFSVQR